MNSKAILALAAFAAVASTGVRAGEVTDAQAQYQNAFQGARTRAEVQAEAQTVPRTRSLEPNGSRVAAPLKSGVDVRTVRAQAAEAVRLGQISHGETNM